MPNHELFDFLRQSSAYIQDEYDVITRRSSEDPGTARDAGEKNWCKLIRDWLPSTYQARQSSAELSWRSWRNSIRNRLPAFP